MSKRIKLADLLANESHTDVDLGCYSLGSSVKIDSGASMLEGHEGRDIPLLHFEIPLDIGTHRLQLVFAHPEALEKLIDALKIISLGSIYPDSVDKVVHDPDEAEDQITF